MAGKTTDGNAARHSKQISTHHNTPRSAPLLIVARFESLQLRHPFTADGLPSCKTSLSSQLLSMDFYDILHVQMIRCQKS